ncbi:MAG: 50S ribosomal protein L25/general stress protein Ctc [Bacteroidaceae bacterium]|nr:50S ribosomal protein L25/general stress protein Ctc [Bacteroidaceae bacterium]
MKTIEIKGTARTIAEHSSDQVRALKEIRKNGGVPCELYGGAGNTHLTVSEKQLHKLVYTPDIYIIDLYVDGKKVNVILKDIQFHPVKDTILHVDFYEINESKPIVMEVPLKMEGLAPGVQAGGKLFMQIRKLKIRALYNVIPERLIIDISNLQLGKSIKVGELSFDKLEIVTPKDAVVCSIKMTRSALPDDSAAATAAAATTAEAAPEATADKPAK